MIGKGNLAMSDVAENRREPWIAVALSLFSTGLGHIYCGRFATGLTLFFASAIPGPLALAAALSGSPEAILPGLLLPCLFVVAVYLYAIAGGYRLAKRIGGQYQPRDYNRGVVYVLFICAGIVYPVSVMMSIRANLFEAFYCAGESMAPTILKGDRFLVNKLFQRQLPERGDIVCFINPQDRHLRFVKRVIALPGDSVAIQGNEVYVNSRKLEHRPASAPGRAVVKDDAAGELYESNGSVTYRILLAPAAEKINDCPETKVPDGHCFLLGDDRNRSLDSRQFGFVPLGDILGKAQFVYWPVNGWSRFGAVED